MCRRLNWAASLYAKPSRGLGLPLTMSSIEPEIVHEDASHRVAFWNNVCISDIWAEVDADQMRAFGEHYRKLLLRYPRGIVVISAVRPSMAIASAEARGETVRFLKELGDRLLQVATVIDAAGVLGLMLRSIIRGMNALVRPGRIVMVEDVERAVELCAPHVVSDLPRADVPGRLMAAIANVRTRYVISLLRTSSDG